MAAGRWVLGLGLLGSIGMVLAQNASVSLPLVVLGQPTIALPLGVWVVLASLAGAGTTGVLTALFRWSNYLTRRATKRELRAEGLDGGFPGPSVSAAAPAASPRDRAGEIPRESYRRWPWSAASPPGSPTSPPSSAPPAATPKAAAPSATEVWDDWAVADRDRDWEEAPPPETSPASPRQPTSVPSHPEPLREVPPPPSSSTRSSSYSYSAQQLRNPAVGRSEAVYDAEYRVIIPPYRELADEATADEYATDAYGDDEYRDGYDDDDRDRAATPTGDRAAADDDDEFDDEFDDETEEADELGDEVFDDWEEETDSRDWPQR